MLELLVAVQGREIRLRNAVEHRGDAGETIDVGIKRTCHLELEIALSVASNHFFEALRQAVVEPLAGGVCLRQRVHEPHRVARKDRWGRAQICQESVEIEAREV